MNRRAWASGFVVAAGLLTGCTASGSFDGVNESQTVLSHKNFKLVKMNASGTSRGFSLFGVISFKPPRKDEAVADLWASTGLTTLGASYALANVAVDESNRNFILVSVPAVTVRADIVEFTE